MSYAFHQIDFFSMAPFLYGDTFQAVLEYVHNGIKVLFMKVSLECPKSIPVKEIFQFLWSAVW